MTQDDFRMAWSTAYWDARDDGMTTQDAGIHADDVTTELLDDVNP